MSGNCCYSDRPPSDIGATHAIVQNDITLCDATVGVITVDKLCADTIYQENGSIPFFNVPRNVLSMMYFGQSGTNGGTRDIYTAPGFWDIQGIVPFNTNTSMQFQSPQALTSIMFQIFLPFSPPNLNPGNITFTVYDFTVTPLPSTSINTVNVDNPLGPFGIHRLIQYDLSTPLPPNAVFFVSVQNSVSGNIDFKCELYGIFNQ